MKIDYLADHADAIPTLAQWHHDEWKALTPTLTLDGRIARFRSRMGRLAVPCAFVAILTEAIAGAAFLVAQDVENRNDLTPWLASVIVGPQYRRRGVGSALSGRVVEEASAIGFAKLYLVTTNKAPFYAHLGWT